MGLLKAAAGLVGGAIGAGVNAAGGALADQWKEYFYCDAIPSEVLVKKGEKRTGGRSVNTKGTDNIISDGSVIAVADGQCMIIVEQGKVAELCAEPGEFIYDNKTSPTIFSGKLSESIMDVFKDIGKRFTFGGEPPKDQRVYYFNTKEIFGNKYGTPSPVPFSLIDKKSGLDLEVEIRCSGEYSYRITNPILFYTNVCANVTTEFRRDGDFGEMMRKEIIGFLRPALGRVAQEGIRYSELTTREEEMCAAIQEASSRQWRERRGIEIVSFVMSNAVVEKEYMDIVRNFQQSVALTNPNIAIGATIQAQNEAVKTAAGNPGGAMIGVAGVGAIMGTTGGTGNLINNLQQQPQQQQPAGWTCACGQTGNTGRFCAGCGKEQPQQQPAAPAGWTCSCGQAGNTGKFCAGCGKAQPADESWTCSCGTKNKGKFCSECGNPPPPTDEGWTCICGTLNKGKFCSECGAKPPAGTPKYICDKCGWEPEDPSNPPKFCPECGDTFDENDIV